MRKTAANKKDRSTITRDLSDSRQEIRFYRANEKPYGAFSNLYRCTVVVDGITYPTAEHAYQAAKARTQPVRDWLLAAPSPALVAMAAHGLYTWDIVPNWSKLKVERMQTVLRAKFSQHAELRALLVGTGSARLVEAGTVDNAVNRMWGEVNGIGKNTLGKLLMQIRSEFRVAPRHDAQGRRNAETRKKTLRAKRK
jgi:ribA/ribD-fused uncharacterized protein